MRTGRLQAVRGSETDGNGRKCKESRASPSDQPEGGCRAGERRFGKTPLTDLKTVVRKDLWVRDHAPATADLRIRGR